MEGRGFRGGKERNYIIMEKGEGKKGRREGREGGRERRGGVVRDRPTVTLARSDLSNLPRDLLLVSHPVSTWSRQCVPHTSIDGDTHTHLCQWWPTGRWEVGSNVGVVESESGLVSPFDFSVFFCCFTYCSTL